MPKCVFERSTGIYKGGAIHDTPVYDSGTHILLTLSDYPNRRTDRWDGFLGVRAATAQELADHDEAHLESSATANISTPLNKTLRDLLLDIEQRLRAAGETSTLPDIAAATNKAQYTAALKDIVKTYL